jgi:Tol biopolymer transport system component
VGRIRPFGITRNGTLYYGLTAGTGDVYEVDMDPKSGKLMSAPSLAIKHYVGFNGTPDYSPDGQSLACISLRGSITDLVPGNGSLVVRSLKTGEEREFPLNIAPGWELKWSPDSRFVLLPGRDTKDRINLYEIDVNTGELKLLFGQVGMNNFTGSRKGWFPDHQSVYLIGGAPRDEQGRAQSRLMRFYLAGKKARDIFRYRSDELELEFVTLSPDGKQFACWQRNRKTESFSLLLIPAEGGEARELFSMKGDGRRELGGSPAGLSWIPDGQHLVYAGRTEPNSKEMDLWRVAVTGGDPEKVGPLLGNVYDVVVHPEGDRVVFSTRELRQEVWMLENFLPAQRATK